MLGLRLGSDYGKHDERGTREGSLVPSHACISGSSVYGFDRNFMVTAKIDAVIRRSVTVHSNW